MACRSFSTLRMLGTAGGRGKRRRPKVRPGERTVGGASRRLYRGRGRKCRSAGQRDRGPDRADAAGRGEHHLDLVVAGAAERERAHLERPGQPAGLAERRERHVIVDRAVAVDADRGGRPAGRRRWAARRGRGGPRRARRRGGSSPTTSRRRRRRSRRPALLHRLTRWPRLIASVRARSSAVASACARLASSCRASQWRQVGSANIVTIRSRTSATTTSISVRPRWPVGAGGDAGSASRPRCSRRRRPRRPSAAAA